MSSASSAKRSESSGATNSADVRAAKRFRVNDESSDKMGSPNQEKSMSGDGFMEEIDENKDDILPAVKDMGPSDLYLDTVS